MQTGMVAVVRQAAQREFSLQGDVRVAVNEGNPDYETFLMDCFPQWDRVYFEDTEACLAAVAEGKADFPNMSSEAVAENFPGRCQSVTQVLHAADSRLAGMCED